MNFGEFMGLLAAVGGVLGFAGILSAAYHRRLVHKERMAEFRAGASTAPALPDPAQLQLIAKLENRVRVLERIATDKSSTLATEIEDLREAADAR